MVVNGLSLAILTGAAFYFIFNKLPKRMRRFMQRHMLLTDAVACLLTYMLFGGTLVALFAAAWLGLIISVMLTLLNNKKISKAIERLASKLTQLKEASFDWVEKVATPADEELPSNVTPIREKEAA